MRLGGLAAEMQSLLAPLADELLQRAIHRSADSGLTCRCDILSGQPRYLVRETLKLAWRREGWPEQAMGLAQWEALAELRKTPRRGGRSSAIFLAAFVPGAKTHGSF